MIRLFYQILKRSLAILKMDTILFIPCLFFYLLLSMNVISEFFKDHVILMGVIQWVVPLVIIQPILMMSSAQLLKQKVLDMGLVFKRLGQLLVPIILVTALHQPWYIFGAFKLSLLDIEQLKTLQTLPNNQLFEIMGAIILGLVIAVITTFVIPLIIDQKGNDKGSVWNKILIGIQLFLKYKWVTIGVLLTYFLVFFSIKLVLLNIFLPILPSYLEIMFLYGITAIERTIYFIFIYRLFLYIRPLANLSGN